MTLVVIRILRHLVTAIWLGHMTTANAGFGSTAFDHPKAVKLDARKLAVGMSIQIDWNGYPVFIVRRDTASIDYLRQNADLDDREGHGLGYTLYKAAQHSGNAFSSLAKPFNEHWGLNPFRSVKPEFVVLSVVSPYTGCAVSYHAPGEAASPKKQGAFSTPVAASGST